MCRICKHKNLTRHLLYWQWQWLKRKDCSKFFKTWYHILYRKAYYKWKANQKIDEFKRRSASLPDSGLRYECFLDADCMDQEFYH